MQADIKGNRINMGKYRGTKMNIRKKAINTMKYQEKVSKYKIKCNKYGKISRKSQKIL